MLMHHSLLQRELLVTLTPGIATLASTQGMSVGVVGECKAVRKLWHGKGSSRCDTAGSGEGSIGVTGNTEV